MREESLVKDFCAEGVDGLMLESFIIEDEVYPTIDTILEYMDRYELQLANKELKRFDEDKHEIRDYILYNAYRITKEI